jgi:RNA polymerase sigma factor (sigma-70 family)
MPDSETTWPTIDFPYVDEFGSISSDVYQAAGELWPSAQRFALMTLHDAPAGIRLMMKAAARVSHRLDEVGNQEIHDLKGYLFAVFKRMVLSELEKEAGHLRAASLLEQETSRDAEDLAQILERKILIDEVVQRMDPQTRRVFELLVLGYTFEEIADRTGVKANVIRSRFSKRINRLTRSIRREIEDTDLPATV